MSFGERIFNQDNAVMKALSKIFDIGYLSLVWIIFSIPVVTIGASTTALYYTTVKVLRREHGYVFAEFWRSFKLNFKPATILWVISGGLTALMVVNMKLVTQLKGDKGAYMVGVYIALCLIIVAVSSYIWPVLSRFDMKAKKILRLAFYMSMKHVLHTLACIVILVACALLVFFFYYVPLTLLVIPAGGCWLISFFMEHVLKKYMPKEEPKVTEDGEEIVQWYQE